MVLHVKTEVHYIAVFYNVFLTFYTQLTRFAAGRFGTQRNKIVVANYFGLDKTFFKICVDHSGSLWRRPW